MRIISKTIQLIKRTITFLTRRVADDVKVISGATVGIITVPFLAIAIIGLVGFAAGGPVGGTAAAAWQASAGNIVAGSSFAFLQSAAMGGPAAAVLITASSVIGGALGAAAGLFMKWWSG